MERVICWGGDDRMGFLAESLRRRGMDAERTPAAQRIPLGRRVILPVPTLDGQGCLTGSRGQITEDVLLRSLLPRTRVMAYLREEEALRWQRLRPDLRLLRLDRDETFLEENGVLSAEGAIALAAGQGRSLSFTRGLVIGYGHLGRALARLLGRWPLELTVTGRNGGSLEAAAAKKLNLWRPDDDSTPLAGLDWVMNTAPGPVLPPAALARLPRGCRWIELASPPYGLSREAAAALGLTHQAEPGIPGRLFPRDAAEAMARAWLRLQEEV